MNEMERKPYPSESMRVRCPHCRKLYLVQFNDVKEAKPRFECIQCHTRFWLSLPDMDLAAELIGIPIQFKEAPQKIKRPAGTVSAAHQQPCPKCFKGVNPGVTECPHCGVILAKLKELSFTEGEIVRSETLAAAWKKVIANYASEITHSDFLRIAQREDNLPYAAAQYAQLLKLMPDDETTIKKVREVQALGALLIPSQDLPPVKPVSAASPRIRKPTAARLRFPRIWQFPLAVAIVLMGMGLTWPVFRNLVGVGAAFLFLALALQIQFGRR